MVLNNRWYRNSDGRGITKWLGPQMAIYTHMYAYIRIYTHIYEYAYAKRPFIVTSSYGNFSWNAPSRTSANSVECPLIETPPQGTPPHRTPPHGPFSLISLFSSFTERPPLQLAPHDKNVAYNRTSRAKSYFLTFWTLNISWKQSKIIEFSLQGIKHCTIHCQILIFVIKLIFI